MKKIIFRLINSARKKSPWIVHLDTGGCNGCDIELLACLTPRYDIERFGMMEKGNPRHSDIFLVTGAVNRKIAPRLKRIYEQIPGPKVVIGIGTCSISTGVFQGSYNIVGPLDKIIPVDISIPGCPPKPEAIMHGILKALDVWEKKLNE